MSTYQYPLSVSSPCLEAGTSSQVTLQPAPKMTRRKTQIQKALQSLTSGFAHTTDRDRDETSSLISSGRESHADSEATCVEYDTDCQTLKASDELPSAHAPQPTTARAAFVAPAPVAEQDPAKRQQLINQSWLERGVDVTKPQWGAAPQCTAEQWEFSVNEFFGDVPASYYRERRAAEKKERAERKAIEKQERMERKAAKKAAKGDVEATGNANSKSKAVLARLATSAGWMQ